MDSNYLPQFLNLQPLLLAQYIKRWLFLTKKIAATKNSQDLLNQLRILGLQQSYANKWWQDCTYATLNMQYSQCLLNMVYSFTQSDVTTLKNYFANQDCLSVDTDGTLSGQNCLSDKEFTINYSSTQVIYQILFKIMIKVESPQNYPFKIKADFNSNISFSNQLYQSYSNNAVFENIPVNSKQLTIKITSYDQQQYSFKTKIQGIMLIVQLCQLNCAQCDQNQVCQKCQLGFYLKANQCVQCNQTCETCDGTNYNNCLSCYSGMYYQKTSKQCFQCDQACKTCDDAGSNNCLSCSTGLYYQQTTKQCVQSCDLNQFSNSQQLCQSCDSSCASCNGPSQYNCLSCISQLYYYQTANQCILCDSTCKTCDDVGQSNCLSCITGLYYQQVKKQCVQSCNLNQFPNSQQLCQSCDDSCASCNGPGQLNCLSCNSGMYYLQATKQCLQCDQSCQTCDGAGQSNCLSCKAGLYYQQGSKQCVKSCDLNQFVNQQQCQQCHNSCATCDGPNQNNCLSCKINTFLYNQACQSICPNGFQSNSKSLTCDQCQNYWSLQCNSCFPSCQLCNNQSQNICLTCYTETRQLDSNNQCACKNSNDQRDIFYQCSYQNIAVIDARLSENSPLLTIDFGSPLKNIILDNPSQLCSQLFSLTTLKLLGGLDSQCQINGSKILVNLSDSANIMENDMITFLPDQLRFLDYDSSPINIFYRNVVYQNPTKAPQLQFSYNHIENSCNPLNITMYSIQNDAGRKFMSLNWTLVQVIGSISNQQQENIKDILLKASQNKNTSLVIDSQYIPSNVNITIQFSYLLKVNQSSSQTFTVIYQKQKFIRVSYQQSIYPPIYRYMSLSFYFSFYIEICELGQKIYQKEPINLQLTSNQFQQQNFNQYNLSSFQYDILPYSLASNSTFNISLVLNLSSDLKIFATQNASVNIQITELYLQIVGGSSFNLGYQNNMTLNTDSRDYEVQDENSPQNINFSWNCLSLSSLDHICYDYSNKQLQLQQGISSLTFPAKTFQPYTIIQLAVIGQKDLRQSNFTATCIFTELNSPPLNVLFSTRSNQKINLNDELSFTIAYGGNFSSDYLSYAGAILYNNDAVSAIKFDYLQVKFRIWNYFQKVDPSMPNIQIRFSVYNPLFIMPSISTINIRVNMPPKNCILNIDPPQGIALQTIFQISLLNCSDDDLPLTYQFFYYNTIEDTQQEIVSPWNIVRRQLQDQSINNSIQTILPLGNLAIMGQAMDSQLGISNSTTIITVQSQDKSKEDYYKFVNELTQQTLQNSNMQVKNQLVTLCIISEDINKNNIFSQELNDLVSLLIQSIQKMSFQIPEFSLLSTFANKETAQLSQILFNSSQQSSSTVQKNEVFKQLQLIVENTNQTIQNNNLSRLHKNNDVQIQNIVDSFKILNSSVTLSTNNSHEDIQNYDQISRQIGNMFNNISLPNQGQNILDGSFSTLLSDKITQKNLFKYVFNLNDSDSTNETNIFSISRNTYKQNIYDNTPEFQAYTSQFKNISQNFTFLQNQLISPQICNSSSQAILNYSSIIYQFNNANYSKEYEMTCLQKNSTSWDKKSCNIIKLNENDYTCICKSQQPTTIIEDIQDMFLKNKNLQTAFSEQGLLNILNFENFYMYIVFWLLAIFTFFQICLFILGNFLDKSIVKARELKVHNEVIDNQQLGKILEQGQLQNQQQVNNQNMQENDQMLNDNIFHSPCDQQLKINEKIKIKKEENKQISSPFQFQSHKNSGKRLKRQKFLNFQNELYQRDSQQTKEQNIEINEKILESNQLQTIKQIQATKSEEKMKTQTSSQTKIIDVQDQEEVQKINSYILLTKIKKVAIFHQFFSIFYIFDNALSRPLRFTLLYLKTIHTLVISIIFYGYNTLIQQIIIALINTSLMKIAYFGIIFTYQKGSIFKCISLILQIGVSLVYYYLILAISSGKTPSESNKFIALFLVSFLIEMIFIELIKSFCMILLIQKYIKCDKTKSLYGKLFNVLNLKQTIQSLDV